MCECLEYSDGARYRCVVCEDMARAALELEGKLGEAWDESVAVCLATGLMPTRELLDVVNEWGEQRERAKRAMDELKLEREEKP